MSFFSIGTSWESLLVFMGILLLSAVTSWLKKKRGFGNDEEWPTQTPRPAPPQTQPRSTGTIASPTPPRPAKKVDWEEELRRLLEGEQPARSAPPPPLPPVIKAPKPVPARPPAFELPRSLQTIQVEDSPNLEEERRELKLARMTESQQAHQKGAQMSELVAARFQQVDDLVERHLKQRQTRVSTDLAQVIAMVRQPRTARQAFVASVVFSAPKGLES